MGEHCKVQRWFVIRFLVLDNESSEESQGSPGEGSEIQGSQVSNTTQYGLQEDIKAFDKHPVLDGMVDNSNSTVGLVLPPSSITSIPSSSSLSETLLPSSFPDTFSNTEQQQPEMKSLTESALILDASVSMDQSYSDPLRNQDDLAHYPKCIKVIPFFQCSPIACMCFLFKFELLYYLGRVAIIKSCV